MCFNQDEAISTLDSKHLKLIDQFTYLGSNISSKTKQCQYKSRKDMNCY